MGFRSNPVSPSPLSPLSATRSQPLPEPTWFGFVNDTKEALQLFEAVLSGQLHRVVRRPHERERPELIRSGNVFIYEEGASGIKRWTDGLPWSPSRILGNFLIYRELEKAFPPGEKKRAAKRAKRPAEPELSLADHDGSVSSPTTPAAPGSPIARGENDRDIERSLIGSLTDSYNFRDGGLVKKTMSVAIDDTHLHLVSYYNPEDVRHNRLLGFAASPLGGITPRRQLLHKQHFRAPLDESDGMIQTSASHLPGEGSGVYLLSHQPYSNPSPTYVSQGGYGASSTPTFHHQVHLPLPTSYEGQPRYTFPPQVHDWSQFSPPGLNMTPPLRSVYVAQHDLQQPHHGFHDASARPAVHAQHPMYRDSHSFQYYMHDQQDARSTESWTAGQHPSH